MSAERVAIIYRKSVLAGICTRCRIEHAEPGKRSCRACLDRKAQYQAEVKARRRSCPPNGLCTRCRNADPVPGLRSCRPCLDAKYKKENRSGWSSTRKEPPQKNKRAQVAPERLAVWQLSHNGKYWHDMPGENDFDKRCNFFFFRRGMYHPERPVAERWQQRPSMFNYPGRVA